MVAIKQTVYRTGADSELMRILIEAAQRGKEITVVVELLARFDEEANINWASQLEEVGAHVVYGIVGHKTHAKLAMVVRREGGRLRRYCHLGTGNYHSRTATLYTDFGLFTCDEEICADVNDVFMQLTSLGKAGKLRHLWQSPFTLHTQVLAAIRRETEQAKAGKKAGIVAKMNALLEPEIIAALYEASKAGVKIDLIVRGVCALRPGVPGLSENIRVRSIIGRFLEHHRVYYFESTGDVYLVQRGLDGAQFLPPHRGRLPDPRPQAQEARHRGGPEEISRRQHAGVGDALRRPLRAPQADAQRGALGADGIAERVVGAARRGRSDGENQEAEAEARKRRKFPTLPLRERAVRGLNSSPFTLHPSHQMPAEIELKLSISPENVPKLARIQQLKSATRGRAVTTKLYSIYYDTPEFALRDQGAALRLRRAGSRWVQTLKTAGRVEAGLHQRDELETPAAGPDPQLHRAGPVQRRARCWPIPSSRSSCARCSSRSSSAPRASSSLSPAPGSSFAWIAARSLAGDAQLPISEIELELKSGPPLALLDFALGLLEQVPLRLEAASKAERGYALAEGLLAAPVKASAPLLQPVDERHGSVPHRRVHLHRPSPGQ